MKSLGCGIAGGVREFACMMEVSRAAATFRET